MVCILHFLIFSSSQCGGEGYAPSCCVFTVSTQQGGAYPSLSCRSHFNMAKRGMPPPCHVFVSFLTCQGGICPFLLHFCYFDVTRRAIPSSSCCSHFNTVRRGMLPPCHVFVSFSTHQGGVCSPHCIFGVLTQRVACLLLIMCPFLSCCSYFNMARRGIPPPCHVFVLFLTHQGGVCPSMLCYCLFDAMQRGIPLLSCHFNMARRDVPSSLCLCFTSDMVTRGLPLISIIYVIIVINDIYI